MTDCNHKQKNVYKLGYTGFTGSSEEAKCRLLSRYNTYFIKPECLTVIAVSDPIKAETAVFNLLKDYRLNGEFFSADYTSVILPALTQVQQEYLIQDHGVENNKNNLKTTFNSPVVNKKEGKDYICTMCDFKTNRKFNYNFHLTSQKHNENIEKQSQIPEEQISLHVPTALFIKSIVIDVMKEMHKPLMDMFQLFTENLRSENTDNI